MCDVPAYTSFPAFHMIRSQQLVTALVIASVFGTMLLVERLRPLRACVEPKLRRIARNLATGGASLAVVTLLGAPLLAPLSRWVTAHHVGLLNVAGLSGVAKVFISIILLDYTLWIWHFASHRIAFLWRFHLVHHVDRDLDSSTALRFHFGEHALSIVYRAAQIVLTGASPVALWVWQLLLFTSILFHHANIELPLEWERRLVRVIVTPRMHAIHHSDQLSETDSNWSNLLSVWDYLHGTILLSVRQAGITIGVPAYRRASDVTFRRLLALPFRRQRRDWHRDDGTLQTCDHDGRPARLAA
jgi:sterol desaturase/sphingolipid hydroxylase (fatty acid hydroxylase superfamily)